MIKKVKYKLIKLYPGSPNIGTIQEVEVYDGHICTNKSWELINLYPEFWEEVVEKNYEILSYHMSGLYKKGVHVIHNADRFRNPQFGGNSEWSIYSVKRVSDGEIFTIGDLLVNDYAIKSIGLVEGAIRIYPQNSFYKLEYAVKAKKPKLFTTKDGVDIYEGDKYWYLVISDSPLLPNWKPTTHIADWDSKSKTSPLGRVQFSTKEKAEEYILLNKPCLSLNDLLNMEYARGIPLLEPNGDTILCAKAIVEEKLK